MATGSGDVNTVTLSKSAYDSMHSINDRANMLLREIIGAMSIGVENGNLSLNDEKIIKTIEILYPDSYRKKVSALKMTRTKNYLKSHE